MDRSDDPNAPRAPGDGELIDRVLAGERAPFEQLVERHGPALLGWLARRARDDGEAVDLYQETWLCAWRGLGRLQEPGRLRAWLFGIAFHTLDKHRRGRARRPAEPLGEREPALEPGPTSLERDEFAGRVRAAIERLPPRQREVFELRALVGLDHAAIAARLGIREDNARANHHQALRKLRAELEDERA
ncbi:MAG TPA: RNA polymerase sigma factor [Planctomycetota bacterium]|nr:RNA polymerase sigma factor [Planctomycetota bacterium]